MPETVQAPRTPVRRPLRVAYLTSYFPPDFGGYGITLASMLPHLMAAGVEPTVIAFSGRGPGSSDRSGDPPYVHRILSPGPGRLADLRRIFEVGAFFRARRDAFDIVHASALGYELYFLMPFLHRLGIPVVIEMVLHGSDDALTLSREIFGRWKLRSLRGTAEWIGLSGVFRDPHVAAGLSPDRFHVLHNPVDGAVFRPASSEERDALRRRLGLDPDARVVLTMGAVRHRKGIDRVLDAWEALAPRAGRDLLLIVGPADVSEGLDPASVPYVAEMRRRAEGPRLTGTVRFEGRTERPRDILAAADLFLFLSRQEGFGTVIIEAMASGLPVVLSPLHGISSEIVTEGMTGHIVPDPADAASVARLVARLLDDPVACRRLGEAARHETQTRFTFAERVARLLGIYDAALRTVHPAASSALEQGRARA